MGSGCVAFENPPPCKDQCPVSMRGLRVDKGSSSRRVLIASNGNKQSKQIRPRMEPSTRGLGQMMISSQHAFSRRKVNSRNRCWGKKKFICLQNMFYLRVKPRTGRRHSETRYQDSGIGNGLGEIYNAGGTVQPSNGLISSH